jgi:hypothetical protein
VAREVDSRPAKTSNNPTKEAKAVVKVAEEDLTASSRSFLLKLPSKFSSFLQTNSSRPYSRSCSRWVARKAVKAVKAENKVARPSRVKVSAFKAPALLRTWNSPRSRFVFVTCSI